MLYSFDCEQDSALWNTVFLHEEITNLSTLTYDSAYIGLFTDGDIGAVWDDYVGCDVARGSYYFYNADDEDWNGSYGYGFNPPAQSVTLLAGPYKDPDAFDNPSGLCDEGTNGFQFGDDVADNERLGMTNFMAWTQVPYYWDDLEWGDIQYYWEMQSRFYNAGEHLLYGGMGYVSSGAYGPECNFMFPGSTDPCNWGLNGQSPNGPLEWNENDSAYSYHYRSGIGATGPFTFYPGQTQELDVAYVFARDFNDPRSVAAIPVMQQRIDSVKSYFAKGSTPCGGGFLPKMPVGSDLQVYPNPATGVVHIEYPSGIDTYYEIYDSQGNLRVTSRLNPMGSEEISVNDLAPGLYFIRVRNKSYAETTRFIKL